MALSGGGSGTFRRWGLAGGSVVLSSLPVLSLPLSPDGFLSFPCVDESETSQLPHLPSIMGSTPLESEAKITTLFPLTFFVRLFYHSNRKSTNVKIDHGAGLASDVRRV